MDEHFDSGLKAQVLRDNQGRVRAIHHSDEYWEATEGSPLAEPQCIPVEYGYGNNLPRQ